MKAYKVVDIDWNKAKTNARIFDQAGGFRYTPNIFMTFDSTKMFSVFNGFYAFENYETAKMRADEMMPKDGKTTVLECELTNPYEENFFNKYKVLVSKEIKVIF